MTAVVWGRWDLPWSSSEYHDSLRTMTTLLHSSSSQLERIRFSNTQHRAGYPRMPIPTVKTHQLRDNETINSLHRLTSIPCSCAQAVAVSRFPVLRRYSVISRSSLVSVNLKISSPTFQYSLQAYLGDSSTMRKGGLLAVLRLIVKDRRRLEILHVLQDL